MTKDKYSVNKVDDDYMRKLKEAKRILTKLKGEPLLEPAKESLGLAIELINRETSIIKWVNAVSGDEEGADEDSD